MKKLLFLTNLYYKANGRNYYEEDLYLTCKLREKFKLVLCNPKDVEEFEDYFDLIIFRNTGSVLTFKEEYLEFYNRVKRKKLNTYNSFDGKADMLGKNYLLELTNKNYPVIPTVNECNKLKLLGDVSKYITKPLDGADSIGLEVHKKDELINIAQKDNLLIQPYLDFKYEVSFYFIDNEFQYALYAPNKSKRWQLVEYLPSKEDLLFCNKFLKWNNLKNGIQRVDACRTKDGQLLLVELEDLNPYLSLLELKEETRNKFFDNLVCSINKLI